MSTGTFHRATVAGLIAPLVLTPTGFRLDGLGLPRLDVGAAEEPAVTTRV